MSDMLIIGSSALTAFRKSLDVTSHNVANVGTEGYSRQRADLYSNAPSVVGTSFLGGGVRVGVVERMYDDFVQKQLVSTTSSVHGYEQALSYGKQVEGIIAGNDQGVQTFMQRYFDSLQTLSDNPTSRVNRQLVLDEANNLTGHINNLSVVLDDTQYQINGQLKDVTNDINRQLQIIQEINKMVSFAETQGRQPPNDLLDKREQALLELSKSVEVRAVKREDGIFDIYSLSGKVPLLTDNKLIRLEASSSPYPSENRIEIYATIGDQRRMISDQLMGGGELGGILDFRKNMLDRAQNELGVTLNAFVASMNWQHHQGYDENGDVGGNLFKPLSVNGFASANNAKQGGDVLVTFNPTDSLQVRDGLPPYPPENATYGEKKADLAAAYKSISEMSPDGYEMYFDGRDWTVTNLSSRESIKFNEVDDGFVQFQGLRFEPTNSLNQAGDRFVVKPHQQILSSFDAVMREGQQIATRGQNPLPGGNPLTDASAPGPGGEGDNVNVANMASLQSKKVLFANNSGMPAETILGGYSRMASSIGMYVSGVSIQHEAQKNTLAYIQDRRDMLSGVSLDEEAANLMRFQQAYQAAAQVMQASQTIFQALLGAVRG